MKTSILPTMALALQVDWLDAYGLARIFRKAEEEQQQNTYQHRQCAQHANQRWPQQKHGTEFLWPTRLQRLFAVKLL